MSFIYQTQPYYGDKEYRAMATYLSSGGWLTEYKKTREFEQIISEFVDSKYTCVVNNCTSALTLALMTLGIGQGDEIIAPDFTMIATANAILLAGAKPILVDVEMNTLCLDFEKVEEQITKKTKAIIFVSLNGRSPDMNNVLDFCQKHKLLLIEDAAQSLGSYWNGKHLGTFGEIGCFSFSSPKIITTGQGGALVTDNKNLYEKMKKIKNFGRDDPNADNHIMLGFNFKFTDLQAVIGLEQMKTLSWRVKRKKEIYLLYHQKLSAIKNISFIDTNLDNTAPLSIDILINDRDQLAGFLKEHGIDTRPFHPAIHTQSPYKNLPEVKNQNFPISKKLSSQGLWLPSAVSLTDKQVKYVCQKIKEFYQK